MGIYWWRTDSLVDDLRRDRVSEDQSVRYAMIDAILIAAVLYHTSWFGAERSWLLVLEFLAVCVVSVVGLHECFKANGGPTGSHFLKRLLCLGVPVGIKFFLFSLVAGHLMYMATRQVITPTLFRDPYFVYQLAVFVFMVALTGLYYWRIAYHMERIATPERSNTTPHADARDVPTPANAPGARAGGRER